MSYITELLPNEPIIVQTADREFKFGTHGSGAVEAIIALLDQQTVPTFMISDIREIVLSFDDLVAGSSLVTRQRAMYSHRNLREGILISASGLINLTVKGLNSPMFGNIKIKSFATLDLALDYLRSVIKADAQASTT